MIPRLAFAVERRRTSEPGLAGRLGGRNAALEQVTERLRGTIPGPAARPSFAAMPHLLWRGPRVTFVRIVFLMQARILLLAGILVASGRGKPQSLSKSRPQRLRYPNHVWRAREQSISAARGCYY